MSLMVFLIAAVPAATVAWVGYNKRSRMLLYGTFAMAVTLGLFTGDPKFIGADITFALIGLYFGHIEQTRSRRRARAEAPSPPPPLVRHRDRETSRATTQGRRPSHRTGSGRQQPQAAAAVPTAAKQGGDGVLP